MHFFNDTATPEIYTELINIDLIAPIWLTQLQLRRMADAGGGHIVAISSVAGRIGAPLRTAYCAAKHGLIGYMDALRTEIDRTHNIKVTNIFMFYKNFDFSCIETRRGVIGIMDVDSVRRTWFKGGF